MSNGPLYKFSQLKQWIILSPTTKTDIREYLNQGYSNIAGTRAAGFFYWGLDPREAKARLVRGLDFCRYCYNLRWQASVSRETLNWQTAFLGGISNESISLADIRKNASESLCYTCNLLSQWASQLRWTVNDEFEERFISLDPGQELNGTLQIGDGRLYSLPNMSGMLISLVLKLTLLSTF